MGPVISATFLSVPSLSTFPNKETKRTEEATVQQS